MTELWQAFLASDDRTFFVLSILIGSQLVLACTILFVQIVNVIRERLRWR